MAHSFGIMSFFQESPKLGNQYDEDVLLHEYLDRVLPPEVKQKIEPELAAMGELASGPLFELSLRSRKEEPELVHVDPWGHRIDEIRVPEAWTKFARLSSQHGLVAIPYERRHGAFSRIHQFAMVYLFGPSSSIYTCPLAMSDGAARTLQVHRNQALIDRAVPHLTSRDPDKAWTSGQWMTERTGGSDVSGTETIARRADQSWRLYGTKWFTSATTSEMTLTLARPEGNAPGAKGLALFYLELRGEDGHLNGIRINRLKDKLGTRMLPTAELDLDGAIAEAVAGLTNGVKAIAPMLQITRTWNAILSVASLRRGVALARDYARRRVAFGAPLSEKPAHVETLAEMESQLELAFLLAFRAVELLGREEAGEAKESELLLLRLLQPIAKLLTAKQAVAGASEALEAFGGAGYIEDTGLPVLLRDAQVLPIWEGTTNVLALDAVRAVDRGEALEALLSDLSARIDRVTDVGLQRPCSAVLDAAQSANHWFRTASTQGPNALEAGARAFAITLGRTYALALMIEHAQWLVDHRADRRGVALAQRLAASGVDAVSALGSADDARRIAFPGEGARNG